MKQIKHTTVLCPSTSFSSVWVIAVSSITTQLWATRSV